MTKTVMTITIDDLTQTLLHAGANETVVLDLDDVMLLTAMGQRKYQHTAELTERRLPDVVQQIMARGVKVIGLTARAAKFAEATKQQLQQAGVLDFPVLHAPGKYQKAKYCDSM